jgi:hypothetical protein
MAEGRQPGSWLEDEDPFAQTKSDKKEVVDEALVFAQKYLIFESGVAKELLEFWTRSVRDRKIAPSASPQEYAYFTGVREFVEGLHQQIQFAKNGGQSPYKER